MTPPNTAKKPSKGPAFGPHPDDAEELRLAAEEAERGEFLSEEESEAFLRELAGEK